MILQNRMLELSRIRRKSLIAPFERFVADLSAFEVFQWDKRVMVSKDLRGTSSTCVGNVID